MPSVETLLREYADHLDRAYRDVAVEELSPPGSSRLDGERPASWLSGVPAWVVVAAAAALVLLVIGGLTLLLGGRQAPEPVAPPQQSLMEKEFGTVAPFRATYTLSRGVESGALIEVAFAGPGNGFRFVASQGRPDLGNVAGSALPGGVCEGGMSVWNGERLAMLEGCEPEEPGFSVQPTTSDFDPLGHLAWQTTDWVAEGGWRAFCAGVDHSERPAESVAGRAAFHIRCVGSRDDVELWVDAETGLVLKLSGSRGSPAWPADFEVIEVDYAPVFAADEFAVVGANGDVSGSVDRVSDGPLESWFEGFGLSAGEVVDRVAGALLDGGNFDLSELRGRPVMVMLWADWCSPCVENLTAFEEVADSQAGRVDFVSILSAGSTPETAAVIVDGAGFTLPVMIDETDNLWRAKEGIPKYLLLDEDGRAVAAIVGQQSTGALEQMIEESLG